MFMNRVLVAWFLVLGGAAFAGDAVPEGPDLGTPVTADQITGWDIGIPPDGSGLPKGSGTAKAGAAVYAAKCASCHGETGEGRSADELTGGAGSLAGENPTQTVGSYWPHATTLFDYVRRSMPPQAPFSLSADETYAVCAFILYLNKVTGADDELNALSLPKIKMPNRDGFIPIYRKGDH